MYRWKAFFDDLYMTFSTVAAYPFPLRGWQSPNHVSPLRWSGQADETQTTGTVAIYNLAPARQQQIFERQGPIQIEAGYPDTVASIFDGQVQRVRHPRQNLARITIIELGDMVRDAGRTGAVSSRSYDGPVTARQTRYGLRGRYGANHRPA